jgi:hypothetical protein
MTSNRTKYDQGGIWRGEATATRSSLSHYGAISISNSRTIACSVIDPCLKCVQVDHAPHGDCANLPGNKKRLCSASLLHTINPELICEANTIECCWLDRMYRWVPHETYLVAMDLEFYTTSSNSPSWASKS